MSALRIDELTRSNQAEVRALILAGLADHWGSIDESLNPDLDDMMASYQAGRTVVVHDGDGPVVGTGTLMPRVEGVAEIMRMSVASDTRRRGIGRRIIHELIATAADWGVHTVVLETTSTWHEVIAFYQSCGFAITHVTAGEFGSDTWFERRLAGRSTI